MNTGQNNRTNAALHARGDYQVAIMRSMNAGIVEKRMQHKGMASALKLP
jgi:hypothetical protein